MPHTWRLSLGSRRMVILELARQAEEEGPCQETWMQKWLLIILKYFFFCVF